MLTGIWTNCRRRRLNRRGAADCVVFGYLEDPKKLMFGSDWPLVSMNPYVEAYKRAIPREHWKAVFHDNAVRVFKLSGQR
jgi:predicted TIM-barrel fold metal-dependent hydrolase